MDPQVSVIIPSYNRAHCVAKAIDSVFEQGIAVVEIVLVDDGSTDSTQELIQRKYDERVCYCYQENQGIPSARNTGIKKARGKYIAFLDSDDFWLPEKLHKQLNLFAEHPEYGLVTSRCGKIRRDCFDKVGLFDEVLLQTQDYDLWLRMAAEYQVGFLNESLAVYLDNAKGISTDSLLGRLYRERVLERDYLKKLVPEKLYNRRMAQMCNVIGRHYIRRGDREKGLSYLKRSRRLSPFSLKYAFYFARGLLARPKTSVEYPIRFQDI